jgi:hypothetical protein
MRSSSAPCAIPINTWGSSIVHYHLLLANFGHVTPRCWVRYTQMLGAVKPSWSTIWVGGWGFGVSARRLNEAQVVSPVRHPDQHLRVRE